MNIQKISLVAASLLIATASHAGFKQTAEICFEVNGNTSPYTFQTKLQSTDFFDTGSSSGPLSSGKRCMSHTYRSGPKSLAASIGVTDGTERIKIIIDKTSCGTMFNQQAGWVTMDPIETTRANVYWTFTITQRPSVPEYEYNYDLVCTHFESN